jgi:hypothetical protein
MQNPLGLRLFENKDWSSSWYSKTQNYSNLVLSDIQLMQFILQKFRKASLFINNYKIIRYNSSNRLVIYLNIFYDIKMDIEEEDKIDYILIKILEKIFNKRSDKKLKDKLIQKLKTDKEFKKQFKIKFLKFFINMNKKNKIYFSENKKKTKKQEVSVSGDKSLNIKSLKKKINDLQMNLLDDNFIFVSSSSNIEIKDFIVNEKLITKLTTQLQKKHLQNKKKRYQILSQIKNLKQAQKQLKNKKNKEFKQEIQNTKQKLKLQINDLKNKLKEKLKSKLKQEKLFNDNPKLEAKILGSLDKELEIIKKDNSKNKIDYFQTLVSLKGKNKNLKINKNILKYIYQQYLIRQLLNQKNVNLNLSKIEARLSQLLKTNVHFFIINEFNSNHKYPNNLKYVPITKKTLNKVQDIKTLTNIGNILIQNLINVLINTGEAQLLSDAFAKEFSINSNHSSILERFCFLLENQFKNAIKQRTSTIIGYKIKLKGRINGNDRKRKMVFQAGQNSCTKFNTQIKYGFSKAITPNGVLAIHCTFFI